MNPISLLGIGQTPCGEMWEYSLQDLIVESSSKALEDAHLSIEDIDAVYIGNMLGGEIVQQSHLGAMLGNKNQRKLPGFRMEAACSSGSVASFQAIQSLRSGMYKTVLVIGAEKMTDTSHAHITEALMQAASAEERMSGITFPGLFALLAQQYMKEYVVSPEDLALSSVLMHQHACQNPKAHFPRTVTIQQVMASPCIADPLKMLDCSPISDGASCIVISTEHSADIQILDAIVETDSLSLSERSTLTSFSSTVRATEGLFQQSQIQREDIDVIELHDCFSISTFIALEDMGLSKPGQAINLIKAAIDGNASLAINPSGGLKAGGHPVGATGVKQIAEVAQYLRMHPEATYGLTHNLGGHGATCVMHLLHNSKTA